MTDVFGEFCAAGLWPGVGQALAAAMREAGIRGPAAVTMDALTALPRVNAKRADRLYSGFIGVQHLFALAEILVPQELPARWAQRLADVLDGDAAQSLRADPWRLLQLADATVAQADRLARALDPGVRRDDERRGRALVDWSLARLARDGHTAAPVAVVAEALRPFSVDAASAVRAAAAAHLVAEVADPGGSDEPWIARTTLQTAESAVAEHIARLDRGAQTLAGKRAVTAACDGLDPVQADAVRNLAEHGVSVLTGGPGTGKSRTVAAVVALCRQLKATLALAAPTGRAAKRLEELTGAEATTVHRLLGARRGSGAERSIFDRDALNPIEAKVVVVDETSMLDVELAAALLAAVPDGAHVMVVGDPAQLPSIGPGRVLGDLIDSAAVPVTELRTLYRQSAGGAIARLATAVRAGNLPPVDDPTHEVVVVPANGGEDAARRVTQLVTDSIPRVFAVPGDQLQVVTPIHRGPAGTQALNRALKQVLNPGRGAVRGYDIGDRVVATANHLDAEPAGYANGEVGTVVGLGDDMVRVAFAAGESEIAGRRWETCCTAGRSPSTGHKDPSGMLSLWCCRRSRRRCCPGRSCTPP